MAQQTRDGIRFQCGVSLVEVMGSLAVMAMISASLVIWVQQEQSHTKASLVGTQAMSMKTAALAYTQNKFPDLIEAGTVPIVVSGDALLPYLPGGVAAVTSTNAMGQKYCLMIDVLSSPPRVEGLLLTVGGQSLDGGQQAVAIQSGGPDIGAVSLVGGVLKVSNGTWSRNIDAARNTVLAAGCGTAANEGHLGGVFSYKGAGAGLHLLYRVALTDESGVTISDLNTLANDISVRGNINAGPWVLATLGSSCPARGAIGKTANGQLLECSGSPSLAWTQPLWGGAGGNYVLASKPGILMPMLHKTSANSDLTSISCSTLGVMTRDRDGTVIGCQQPKGASAPSWLRMGGKGIYWKTLFPTIDLMPFMISGGEQSTYETLNLKALPGVPKNVRLYVMRLASAYAYANIWQTGIVCGKTVAEASDKGFDVQFMLDPTVAGLESCHVNWTIGGAHTAEMVNAKMTFQIIAFLCEGDTCTY